jgi:hypothetical protein
MTITCDACGTAKDTQVQPDSIEGHGWFTVSRTGYLIAADPIPPGSMMLPRPPDLCSWKCVAAFAQKRQAALDEAEPAARLLVEGLKAAVNGETDLGRFGLRVDDDVAGITDAGPP